MPKLQRNVVNKLLDTADMDVGKMRPRKMSAQGKASLEPQIVEQVDKPVDKEWADMMRFAQDPITFMVMPASEKNAEDPVYCANNGDPAPVKPRPGWLYRNTEYTVPRRFIESLLRAKIISYTQRKELDPAGIQQIVNVPSVACRYQLRIIHDPHPRGADWFKHIMLEAP